MEEKRPPPTRFVHIGRYHFEPSQGYPRKDHRSRWRRFKDWWRFQFVNAIPEIVMAFLAILALWGAIYFLAMAFR